MIHKKTKTKHKTWRSGGRGRWLGVEFKARLIYIAPQQTGGHSEARASNKQTRTLNALSLWLVLRIQEDVSRAHRD